MTFETFSSILFVVLCLCVFGVILLRSGKTHGATVIYTITVLLLVLFAGAIASASFRYAKACSASLFCR